MTEKVFLGTGRKAHYWTGAEAECGRRNDYTSPAPNDTPESEMCKPCVSKHNTGKCNHGRPPIKYSAGGQRS